MQLTTHQYGKALDVARTEPHRFSDAGIEILAKSAMSTARNNAMILTSKDVERIMGKLRKMEKKAKEDNGAYAVVYSTLKAGFYSLHRSGPPREYAVFVHEDVSRPIINGRGPKFLERAFRENKQELKAIVKKYASRKGLRGGGVRAGLYNAAKKLLSLSQRYVPIETGLLLSSGYIEKER